MSVGQVTTSNTIDNKLTQFAVQIRNDMQEVANLVTQVIGSGNGLNYLESIGYSPADAATALQYIDYLSTVSGVWFGTASQATDFNFNTAFSPLWGGQT